MGKEYERHNRLARDFVFKAGKETESDSELMVVIESTILATMLLLQHKYGFTNANSVVMLESALQNATERLTNLGEQNG